MRISKPATTVRLGDALTFPQGREIRLVVVLAFGVRRGPAPEARALYEDRTPPAARTPQTAVVRPGPKPSKADRRTHERLKSLPS